MFNSNNRFDNKKNNLCKIMAKTDLIKILKMHNRSKII